MPSKLRPRRLTLLASALTLATAALALPGAPASADTAPGSIDFSARHQRIDGFGVSQAFQRAAVIHGLKGLSAEKGDEIVKLLFSREDGAGLSMLRLGVGSSTDEVYDHMRTIAPNAPASPDDPLTYTWDGKDGGQVWLAKEARKYGVKRFIADAWSAPAYMKDNNSDSNGGTLCGVVGTDCATGDWRTAYGKYLAQYVKFYKREGVRITDLDFTNEPDWKASYASMLFTPAQAADAVKAIGPVLRAEAPGTKLYCCDSFGWNQGKAYAAAIAADPAAEKEVAAYSAHGYASAATSPLINSDKPAWMSEWAGSGVWPSKWDDGTNAAGLYVAENIHNALAQADASAYLFWLGASIGDTGALIRMDGDSYMVSTRLRAMTAFSRFIRPGAVRVEASSGDEAVLATAYRNTDGTDVAVLINTGTKATTTDMALKAAKGEQVTGYLTDGDHDTRAVEGLAQVADGHLTAKLPARSVVTVVLDPGRSQG
ncbi:glycoside hydrolase family 30 protein [Streptomyces sp. CA-142005]|uniref:glycoside hydrolase family 30 protein n=1 Tax=Streptomyces sp. CA-142005 TaxID=3240052 RepID=UPI003D925879